MSPPDPPPHPPPHLHLAMLSVADSVCQQLWGACPGPRWGTRHVGWSASWGALGPAEKRPSPCVGRVSADARDSAPGNRASAGCMVAEGQVPRDRDTGRPVFSSSGGEDPPKTLSILEAIRAILRPGGLQAFRGAVWTDSGHTQGSSPLLSIFLTLEGLPWAQGTSGTLPPGPPALTGPCTRLKS